MSELSPMESLVLGSGQDPVPFLSRVREEDPVCWLPVLDCWLVTRHDDVRGLFVDPRVTADPRVFDRYVAPADPVAAKWLNEMPFRTAPADPKSGRRLVLAATTPRAAEMARMRIREVVQEVSATLKGREGVIDFVGEYTSPVAATVISRILGVPPKGDDEARFQKLARNATRAIRPFLSPKKRMETEKACAEICEYVSALIDERRVKPGDDMISDLIRASDMKDPSATENIARVVAALVSAGTGTSGTAGARALRTLLGLPQQLEALRRDEGMVPRAVEELLRYDSGQLVMPRYVVEDFELRGKEIRKGQLIALCLLGANRDPRVFADPDRVDFDRDNSLAMSFGFGRHYCAGANIARTTLAEMLKGALHLLPSQARLVEDQVRWSARGMMSQLSSLPVDVGPAPVSPV